MTVNNVNTLPPLGAAQAGQTSVKSGEAAKESFDRLISKMNDQLAGMTQSKTAETAVQVQAPKRTETKEEKNVQETARPKDEPKKAGNDRTADADGKADTDKAADADEKTDTDKVSDANGKTDAGKTEEAEKSQEEETSVDGAVVQEGFGLTMVAETGGVQDAGIQAAVEEAADGLAREIADLLDIPLEKVEKAMEALGLTTADLFDTNNMKQLLLNLTGNTDEMAFLTDGTLYDNLQDIFRIVQDTLKTLQSELGMNEKEVKALIAQVGEEQKLSAETEQPELTTAETKQPVLTAELSEAGEPRTSVEGMKDYTVSVQKESGTVQIKVTVDDESGEKRVDEQLTDVKKPETQPVFKNENMADTGHKGEGQTGEQNAANNLMQHLTGTGLAENVETPAAEPVYTEPSTSQIMDQVMEYMKVNIRPETQELEMQLHPANLGTVHVQLAAKNGVITAQFAAQNETVKAVLETQMIQLKEQFEEQGIKVESVEVTVAEHGFGEQLGNGQEAADKEQETAKKGSRRIRLNLDELEEGAIEELDDSERIAVEMMRANGSTVDYTA